MSHENKLHGYFETDMFLSGLDDADVDRVMLGHDCAEWFKSRLVGTADVGEPVQESYGWASSVTIAGRSLWLMLQKWHTTERGWHVWIEPRGLLARVQRARAAAGVPELRRALDRIAANEPRVGGIRWVHDPAELE